MNKLFTNIINYSFYELFFWNFIFYFAITKTNAQKVFSETKIFTNFKNRKQMKNLKEMSLEEMRQTEGGNLGLAIVAIVLVCVLAYYMTRENDRDK